MLTATLRPWSPTALRKAVAGNAVGFTVLAAGWLGASRDVTLAAQSKWAILSVLGLALAGAANAALLRDARRTISFRYRRFVIAQGVPDAQPGLVAHPAGEILVFGGTMTMFHRPDCRLVMGKPVRTDSRVTHERAGRRPCGVCGP